MYGKKHRCPPGKPGDVLQTWLPRAQQQTTPTSAQTSVPRWSYCWGRCRRTASICRRPQQPLWQLPAASLCCCWQSARCAAGLSAASLRRLPAPWNCWGGVSGQMVGSPPAAWALPSYRGADACAAAAKRHSSCGCPSAAPAWGCRWWRPGRRCRAAPAGRPGEQQHQEQHAPARHFQ